MGDVNVTIDILQPLIDRPKLKDKLLKKPPFRFLHDIVTNLIKKTGFPDVFNGVEMDSSTVKTRDAKVLFLEKLIKATEIATGDSIDVRPTKICAGSEADKTNNLLQAMARSGEKSNNGELDNGAIRSQIEQEIGSHGGDGNMEPQTGGGEAPAAEETAPPAEDNSHEEQARAEAERAEAAAAAAAKREEEARRAEEERERRAEEAQAAPAPEPEKPTKSRSRRGSRDSGATLPIDRDVVDLPDNDSNLAFWENTKETLGKLIQKPKMAEKLLNKPPFRYLHDICTCLIRATGFPKGAFNDDEMDHKNIKDTKSKLKFLTKLINIVAIARNNPGLNSQVNPKKIAAGLEPENTNILLQELARAAASGVSVQACIKQMGSGSRSGSRANSRSGSRAGSRANTPPVNVEPEPAAPEQEEEAQGRRAPTKAVDMPKIDVSKAKEEEKVFGADNAGMGGGDLGETKLKKTKTARRAPPKLKQTHIVEEQQKAAAPTGEGGALTSGVILDGQEEEEDEDEEPEAMAEAEPLFGFNEAEVAGAEDGEHGKLMLDILAAQKQGEEEKKEEEAKGPFNFKRLASSRKVQQAGHGFSKKNVQALRAQIQKICQSVNPLGKCIDFVYEDMDSMSKELQMWRRQYQSNVEKYEEEKVATVKLLEPLQTQLNKVEADILDQMKKTHALKGDILRNDATIQNLLEAQSMVDGLNV